MAKKQPKYVVYFFIALVVLAVLAQSGVINLGSATPVNLILVCPPDADICVIGGSTTTNPIATASTGSNLVTALNQLVHVADSYITDRVNFVDGSSTTIQKSAIIQLAYVLYQGKQVESDDIQVRSLSYDISTSLPTGIDTWYDIASATVTIKMNDAIAFQQTFTDIKQCAAGCAATTGTLFNLATVHFNTKDWVMSHLQGSGTQTFTKVIQITEHWEVWGVNFGHSIRFAQGDVDGGSLSPTTLTYDPNSVNPPQTFQISISPTKLALGTQSGFQDRVIVGVTGNQGFSGTVNVIATGVPSGVTAQFDRQSGQVSAFNTWTSQLTVTSSANAKAGGYSVTITASSQNPAYSASAQLALTIGASGTCTSCQQSQSAISLTADSLTVAPGTVIHLTGTLASNSGTGISGSISIKPQWQNGASSTASSGANGNFAADVTMPTSEGKYVIVAEFAGDSYSSAASSSITITVSANASNSGNNNGNNSNSGNQSCTILRIPGATILGQPTADLYSGIELPAWLCGSTFGVPNWQLLIAAIVIGLVGLYLLTRRSGGSSGGTNVYVGG